MTTQEQNQTETNKTQTETNKTQNVEQVDVDAACYGKTCKMRARNLYAIERAELYAEARRKLDAQGPGTDEQRLSHEVKYLKWAASSVGVHRHTTPAYTRTAFADAVAEGRLSAAASIVSNALSLHWCVLYYLVAVQLLLGLGGIAIASGKWRTVAVGSLALQASVPITWATLLVHALTSRIVTATTKAALRIAKLARRAVCAVLGAALNPCLWFIGTQTETGCDAPQAPIIVQPTPSKRVTLGAALAVSALLILAVISAAAASAAVYITAVTTVQAITTNVTAARAFARYMVKEDGLKHFKILVTVTAYLLTLGERCVTVQLYTIHMAPCLVAAAPGIAAATLKRVVAAAPNVAAAVVEPAVQAIGSHDWLASAMSPPSQHYEPSVAEHITQDMITIGAFLAAGAAWNTLMWRVIATLAEYLCYAAFPALLNHGAGPVDIVENLFRSVTITLMTSIRSLLIASTATVLTSVWLLSPRRKRSPRSRKKKRVTRRTRAKRVARAARNRRQRRRCRPPRRTHQRPPPRAYSSTAAPTAAGAVLANVAPEIVILSHALLGTVSAAANCNVSQPLGATMPTWVNSLSLDARADEKCGGGLYGGEHPVQQFRGMKEVAETCAAVIFDLCEEFDDVWADRADRGISADARHPNGITTRLRFCKFEGSQQMPVDESDDHRVMFDERVTSHTRGVVSSSDDDIELLVTFHDTKFTEGDVLRSRTYWDWTATAHDCPSAPDGKRDGETVTLSSRNPHFSDSGGAWYLCGADSLEHALGNASPCNEHSSNDGDDEPEARPPSQPRPAEHPADGNQADDVDDSNDVGVDEPPAATLTDAATVKRTAETVTADIGERLADLKRRKHKVEGIKLRIKYCRFQDASALVPDHRRAATELTAALSSSVDDTVGTFVTFQVGRSSDRGKTTWRASYKADANIGDHSAIGNHIGYDFDSSAVYAHDDFKNTALSSDRGSWYAKEIVSIDEKPAAAAKPAPKRAAKRHRKKQSSSPARPASPNRASPSTTRDVIHSTVDNSPRAIGRGAGFNFDNEDIKTEAEINPSCHPALRLIVLNIVGEYRATMTREEKAIIFHEFLSVPKRYLRRVEGSVKRKVRDRFLKMQLGSGQVHKLERASESPAARKVPTAEMQAEAACKQATSLAARGYIGKAACAVERVVLPQAPREKMVEKMEELHPAWRAATDDTPGTDPHHPPTADTHDPLGRSPAASIQITADELQKAISNACKAAAPGPTGWTEELMLPLFVNPTIARALALMANDVANYDVTECVRDRLTSCRLIAVPKPCGGTRPIAVSDILLKAVASVLIGRLGQTVADHFDGLQYGIMYKGGADTVAHKLRQLIQSDPAMQLVALDATNAFNTPSRASIANALYKATRPASHDDESGAAAAQPSGGGADGSSDDGAAGAGQPEWDEEKWESLWNLFMLEYGKTSDLMLHDGERGTPTIVKSAVGSRQGSCLGGFYFSLALLPSLVEARRRFGHRGISIYAYLDDVTLAGTDVVALSECADFLCEQFGAANVKLNPSKCEWYGDKQHERTGVAVKFNKNGRVKRFPAAGGSVIVDENRVDDYGAPVPPEKEDATDVRPFERTTEGEPTKPGVKILGCFLSRDDAWVSEQLTKKLSKHDLFFERLKGLDGCTASALLSACGVPRMAYYVRVHEPDTIAKAALGFDKLVVDAWSRIAKCEIDDITRTVAHLPARVGGGGFTRYDLIRAAAFEASLAEVNGDRGSSQSSAVERLNNKLRDDLLSKDKRLAVHLSECAKPGASTWFRNAAGSLDTDNDAFAAMLCFRLFSAPLGAKIAMCPGCNHLPADMRDWMSHVLGCARIRGQNASCRHKVLKEVMDHRVFAEAGVGVLGREPRYKTSSCPGTGCSFHGAAATVLKHCKTCTHIPVGKRAAVRPHQSGPDDTIFLKTVTTLDYTIVSTTCLSNRRHTDAGNMTTFRLVTQKKHKKYAHVVNANGERFVVFAASALGNLAPDAVNLLKEIAKSSRVSYSYFALATSQAITQASGTVLLNAMREAGMFSAVPTELAADTPLTKTAPPAPLPAPVVWKSRTASPTTTRPTTRSAPTGGEMPDVNSACDPEPAATPLRARPVPWVEVPRTRKAASASAARAAAPLVRRSAGSGPSAAPRPAALNAAGAPPHPRAATPGPRMAGPAAPPATPQATAPGAVDGNNTAAEKESGRTVHLSPSVLLRRSVDREVSPPLGFESQASNGNTSLDQPLHRNDADGCRPAAVVTLTITCQPAEETTSFSPNSLTKSPTDIKTLTWLVEDTVTDNGVPSRVRHLLCEQWRKMLARHSVADESSCVSLNAKLLDLVISERAVFDVTVGGRYVTTVLITLSTPPPPPSSTQARLMMALRVSAVAATPVAVNWVYQSAALHVPEPVAGAVALGAGAATVMICACATFYAKMLWRRTGPMREKIPHPKNIILFTLFCYLSTTCYLCVNAPADAPAPLLQLPAPPVLPSHAFETAEPTSNTTALHQNKTAPSSSELAVITANAPSRDENKTSATRTKGSGVSTAIAVVTATAAITTSAAAMSAQLVVTYIHVMLAGNPAGIRSLLAVAGLGLSVLGGSAVSVFLSACSSLFPATSLVSSDAAVYDTPAKPAAKTLPQSSLAAAAPAHLGSVFTASPNNVPSTLHFRSRCNQKHINTTKNKTTQNVCAPSLSSTLLAEGFVAEYLLSSQSIFSDCLAGLVPNKSQCMSLVSDRSWPPGGGHGSLPDVPRLNRNPNPLGGRSVNSDRARRPAPQGGLASGQCDGGDYTGALEGLSVEGGAHGPRPLSQDG